MLGEGADRYASVVSETNELGAFLRTLREAVTPAEVGLPSGSRRRTPGLRRSELATLAGISVEYLTRLEQGRDRNPSGQVLGALADALRLSAGERLHLHRLAKASVGDRCLAAEPPASSVRPALRALLDRLEPGPAALLNRLSDVLACTSGYERLAGPIGMLDGQPANLVRYLFTDPRARTAFPEWERVADEHVADFKGGFGGADPHIAVVVDELAVTAGAQFSKRWEAAPTLPNRTRVERLVHPDVGELRLTRETLEPSEADDQRLVVYLAADEVTSAALDRITGRQPGALRAVSG
jgi:transcriptional regulator with XRE-family HTH domain